MNKTKRRATRTYRRKSLRRNYKGGMIKTKKYPNGDSLTGDFDSKNRLIGPGKWTYANGESYEGAIRDNKPHGKGTFTWPAGHKYVGNHVNGKMEGEGVFTYPDGSVYEGSFNDGKKHGRGTFRISSGEVYAGDYANDKPNGTCKHTWPNGDSYEGGVLNGLKHGHGTLNKNGHVYVGSFVRGLIYGHGALTYPDGRVYEGMVLETPSGQLIGKDDMPPMEPMSDHLLPPGVTPDQAAYKRDVKRAQHEQLEAIARSFASP